MKRMVCFLLTAVFLLPLILHAPLSFAETPLSPPIIYVSRDGSGTQNYTCDGEDDQVQINKAIEDILKDNVQGCHTIHLKPGVYKIKEPILMGGKSGQRITLEGEGTNTVILLDEEAIWPKFKGVIMQRSESEFKNNFIIRNLKMDGNALNMQYCIKDGQQHPMNYYNETGNKAETGQDWHDLIYLIGCTNVEVYGMYFTNSYNDALRIKDCTNVRYHDSQIIKIGHDGLQSFRCNNVYAYNNYAELNVNCGFRIYNTNHAEVHDNEITSNGKGGAGIQIQQEGSVLMNDVKVYNNKVYSTHLSGIWIFGAGSFTKSYRSKAKVYNNLIYNCGTKASIDPHSGGPGGILVCGMDAEITNNTIDACTGFGIGTLEVYHVNLKPPAMDYTINIKNNIITNTKTHSLAGGKGYGIYNKDLGLSGVTHAYNLNNNCIFNSATAVTYGTVSQSNTTTGNPLFKDSTNSTLKNRDYHLQSNGSRWNGSGWTTDGSSSPCINAGYSNSTKEPTDISAVVNLGRYGDTLEASTARIQSPFAKVNPIADTYIESGQPNLNYGYNKALAAKSSNYSNLRRKTYIKFNFSGYTGSSASKAILRIYGDFTDSIAPYTIYLYRTANEAWSETQVTWNNNPDSPNDTYITSVVTDQASTDCPVGRWYEFDVTSIVNQNMSDKIISFRVESNNLEQYITFNSREAAQRKPELIIFK